MRSGLSGSTTGGGRFRPTPSAAPVSRPFVFEEEWPVEMEAEEGGEA